MNKEKSKKLYLKTQFASILKITFLKVFILLSIPISIHAPAHQNLVKAYEYIGSKRGDRTADISPSLITITSHIESLLNDLYSSLNTGELHKFRSLLLDIGEYVRFALGDDIALYVNKEIYSKSDQDYIKHIRAVLLAVSRAKVLKELGKLGYPANENRQKLSPKFYKSSINLMEEDLIDSDIQDYLLGDIDLIYSNQGFDPESGVELRIHSIDNAGEIMEVKASVVICKSKSVEDIAVGEIALEAIGIDAGNRDSMNNSDTDNESLCSDGLLTPRNNENNKVSYEYNASDYKRCFR